MPVAAEVRVNPFLHVDENRIYNPLTDRTITPADTEWEPLRAFLESGVADATLESGGWVPALTGNMLKCP